MFARHQWHDLLSLGEQQRISLVRLIYHRPVLAILDEATSALDDETEQAVMAEVIGKAGSMAMLVIAHRDSTLARCERRIEINGGRLREVEAATGR